MNARWWHRFSDWPRWRRVFREPIVIIWLASFAIIGAAKIARHLQ